MNRFVNLLVLSLLCLLFVFIRCATSPAAKEKSKEFPFYVYKDIFAEENHYSSTGWMGDWDSLKIQDVEEAPQSGETCLKVTYKPEKESQGWVGVYWQDPADNWGDKEGGYDLTGAKQLTFWAKGEKGRETVTFKFGGVTDAKYPDTGFKETGPIRLTENWKQYKIKLKGQNLKQIISGFCFVIFMKDNPDGCTFYLDNIGYENE
ncbi:MAG: hypothetical protein JW983_06995 [Elusimicrobia bacterium]|nr:hypothetical protein [Elusimicrobiota bacterium]